MVNGGKITISPFTIHCLLVIYFLLRFLLLIYSNLKIIELVGNITITNVNAVHFGKYFESALQVAHLFVSGAEFILQRLVFVRGTFGSLEALLEPKYRRPRHTL